MQLYIVEEIGARCAEDAIGEEIASMLADLRRDGRKDVALFFRVEIGKETFRIDSTDHGPNLPLGSQVLIR
jgi:hypothetical protein